MERKGTIKWKTMGILLLLIAAACLFIFHSYLIGDQVLVFTDVGSDTKEQYIPWYHYMAEAVRSRSALFGWNFEDGLGASAYNLNLFAPFLWIAYMTGALFGPEHIAGAMVYIFILEIILAGECCYLLLSNFDYREDAKLLASFMYAFNGYLLVWGQHYSLGGIMVLLPLLLLSVEKALNNKKALFATAFICALGIFNGYYQGYMMILGSAMYVTIRTLFYDTKAIGIRFKNFITIALSMAAGLVMGALNLLPALGAVGESSRLSSEASILQRMLSALRPWSKEYYRTFLYRFFGSNLQGAGNDFLGTGNYYEAVNIFFSVLFIFLLAQYGLTIHRRSCCLKQKLCRYVGLAIGAFMVLIPAGSLPFNAFAYEFSRHTFLLMPFFAMISADVLTNFLSDRIFSITGVILAVGISCGVYAKAYTNYMLPSYETNALILFAGAVMTAVLLLMFYRKKIAVKETVLGLLGVLIITTLSDGSLTVRYRNTVHDLDSTYSEETYHGDTAGAIAWIKEQDEGYYRIEKDYAEAGEYLDSMIQHYSGVSTYNSMMTSGVLRFVSELWPQLNTGYDKNHLNFRNAVHEEVPSRLAGVKYLLSREETLSTEGYEMIHQVGTVYIYQNRHVDNIASFYTETVSEDTFEEKARETDLRSFMSEVLITDTGASEENLSEEELEKYVKQERTDLIDPADMDAAQVQQMAEGLTIRTQGSMTIPFSTEISDDERVWVEFTINSDESAPILIYAGDGRSIQFLNKTQGFFSLEMPQGTSHLRFETLDAEEIYEITGLRVYASEQNDTFLEAADIEVFREASSVYGTVDATQAGYVLLSIPNQAGWTLTVDGEETQILTGDFAFMAFYAEEGDHSFRLSYTVPYIEISKILTIISWGLWVFGLVIVHLKSRRNL